MTTYVGITEHPPQLCQTSNKTCGQLYRQLVKKLSDTSSFGVTVKIGPLITSDHRSFWVIETDEYENVRKFVAESGMIQWNSVTTLPVIDADTALAELEVLTPIFDLPNPA